MDFLTDWITKWLKGMLIDGIMGNLNGLFTNVNNQVGEIAQQVGTTPAAWNAGGVLPHKAAFRNGCFADCRHGAHLCHVL